MSEVEVVQYSKIDGMTAFFNDVAYRSAHLHQEWELVWIIENSMGINSEGASFIAKEGDLVIFSPSQVHEFRKVDDSCTFMCLQISPSLLGISNLLVSKSMHPEDYLSADDLEAVRCKLYKMMKKYVMQENMYQTYCKGQCSIVMYMILSKMPLSTLSDEENSSRSKKSERLVRFIDFVDANYQHKVKLYEFAKSEGVTLCYISHFIQKALNQNFQDYLNTVRFNHACALIAKGNMKMVDIYRASGFSDYKYFARTFLEKCGKSPEDYSKELLSGSHVVGRISTINSVTVENIFDKDKSIELLIKINDSRRKV